VACSYLLPKLKTMDKIESKIEKLERKIEKAEEKQNKYQEMLERISEGQQTSRWEKLLDSASQELHDLRQEKLKLIEIEERRDLERNESSKVAELRRDVAGLKDSFTGLNDSFNKYMEKVATIPFSALDLKILEEDGVKTEAVTLEQHIAGKEYPPFKWINMKEDSKQNKDAYLEYVSGIMEEFLYIKIEVASNNLLDCVTGLAHHLKGTTDLIAYPVKASGLKRNHLNMVIELKPNAFVDNNIAQTIGEVIAANSLSHDCKYYPSPVGVLTDLMDQWSLVWISKTGVVTYASSMSKKGVTSTPLPLDRNTALHYMKMHIDTCNRLADPNDATPPEKINLAFGSFECGYWKKLETAVDARMDDFLDSMTAPEIENYQLKKTFAILENSNIFPPAAEDTKYLGMFS
jgi:hypothetical protein